MSISKWPTIPVPPEAHRDLVRDAYAAGGDITEAMARIVGEAIGLWRAEQERREQQSGRYTIADGTAPGTSRVTPDNGAWLVAGPVLCRVTGLEPRECACSGCSAARRRKG